MRWKMWGVCAIPEDGVFESSALDESVEKTGHMGANGGVRAVAGGGTIAGG